MYVGYTLETPHPQFMFKNQINIKKSEYPCKPQFHYVGCDGITSRKHLRTNVTPNLHFHIVRMGEVLGWNQNDKK